MKYNFNLIVDLTQTIGIIVSFIFTIFQLRSASKITKFNIFWQIGESHRQVWQGIIDNPDLSRIVDEEVNIEAMPITHQERMSVINIILHIEGVHVAHCKGYYKMGKHELRDINELFHLPIFKTIWIEIMNYQKKEFKDFIEKLRNTYSQLT